MLGLKLRSLQIEEIRGQSSHAQDKVAFPLCCRSRCWIHQQQGGADPEIGSDISKGLRRYATDRGSEPYERLHSIFYTARLRKKSFVKYVPDMLERKNFHLGWWAHWPVTKFRCFECNRRFHFFTIYRFECALEMRLFELTIIIIWQKLQSLPPAFHCYGRSGDQG